MRRELKGYNTNAQYMLVDWESHEERIERDLLEGPPLPLGDREPNLMRRELKATTFGPMATMVVTRIS